MTGLPSTQATFEKRQERKEREEKEHQRPQIECEIEELRAIKDSRAPLVGMSDASLRVEWELAGYSKLELAKTMLELQVALLGAQTAHSEAQKAAIAVETAVEHKAAAVARKHAAEEDEQAAKESRKRNRLAFEKSSVAEIKKKEQEADLSATTAQKAKLELEEMQRKANKKARNLSRPNQLMPALLRKLIKNRFPDNFVGKCEMPGCINEISHAAFRVLSPEGFVPAENGSNFNELKICCPEHVANNQFPVLASYYLRKELVETLFFRQGLPVKPVVKCAGCGPSCDVCIHSAEVMHLTPASAGGSSQLSNVDLGCDTSNKTMAEQPLTNYRAERGAPYVPTTQMTPAEARGAAKAVASLTKRTARLPVRERVQRAIRNARRRPARQRVLSNLL